jgi:DUF1680 family protein
MIRLCLFFLCCAHVSLAASSDTVRRPGILLGGEMGEAEQLAEKRMFQAPFTSTAWIRADLTNERATANDSAGPIVWRRPFKAFSGDISGRYLELMSLLSYGDRDYHPSLRQLLQEIPTLQKPDGTFGWAAIDWNGQVDFNEKGHTPLMMPALWGNGRMLCGLVQAYATFGDAALLASAKKLGDFYVRTQARFMDPARIAEYKKGGSYASGFVTCYFNAFEGLVRLYRLTHDPRYLQVSKAMAAFLQPFDVLPLEHAHGMLCNQFALLLLYEETGERPYLQRAERRWEQMVAEGYTDPAGGVLEGATIGYKRDEGCAETDWLRVNLELFRVTAQTRYLDRAERLLRNHYLANQCSTGGFGHRYITSDHSGVTAIGKYSQEATWCCDFHGTQGFQLLLPYLSDMKGTVIRVNFAMDFEVSGLFRSSCEALGYNDSVFVQRLSLKGDSRRSLEVRKPEWAKDVTVFTVAADGKEARVSGRLQGNYYVVGTPLTGEVVVRYQAPVYRESRTGVALKTLSAGGQQYVVRHGPYVLMAAADAAGNVSQDMLQPRALWQDSLKTVMVF